MIVRGFKSVLWVGAVGGAALSCYMVSLRVATERADLARVERQIVDTKRDIRSLETELDTRGRLTQLEDWNANVLALSAPSSNQFVKDAYTLARLTTHEQTVEDRTGNVRMASLETGRVAAAARPDSADKPKSVEGSKPAKTTPAAPVHRIGPLPRVIEAVAPTPPDEARVHRASFDTSETAATAKTGDVTGHAAATHTPAKAGKIAKGDSAPTQSKKAMPSVTADAASPKKVKTTGKSVRTAHADTASHLQSSGHRGGAQ